MSPCPDDPVHGGAPGAAGSLGPFPAPPEWQANPHNGAPRDYYRYGIDSRAYIRAWIDHALSPGNRAYRLERLAAAIGFSQEHVLAYVEGRASFGSGLQEAVNAWASGHAEISPNAPTEDTTIYAHLGDLG